RPRRRCAAGASPRSCSPPRPASGRRTSSCSPPGSSRRATAGSWSGGCARSSASTAARSRSRSGSGPSARASPAAAPPGRPVGAEAVNPPVRLNDLLQADRRHVWHPYGPMPGRTEPLVVASAAGVRLRLAGGAELVDGMSSWWAAIHGYRHPALDAAAADQLGRMAHVMLGGLTHEPAVRLAERLVAITPAGLEHVFFCDSGSVAVEVAVKMAVQYWQA